MSYARLRPKDRNSKLQFYRCDMKAKKGGVEIWVKHVTFRRELMERILCGKTLEIGRTVRYLKNVFLVPLV